MINQGTLKRLILCDKLNRYMHAYFQKMGLAYTLQWEIRSEQLLVSNCFSLSDNIDTDTIVSTLN